MRIGIGLDWPSRRFRKRFLLPLLSVLILLCPSLAGVASAGVNTWTSNGPDRGDVRALAIDPANPATLYAGASGGGVIKSTNGGGNWTVINSGLTSTDVRALAIDPANPATLYAGTSGGGVFKSTNGGGSWTATNTGLTSTDVRALAIGPGNPATVYAGTSDAGVFQSINGGGSWNAMNTGLTSTNIRALTINRWNPVLLYAGTSGGVFTNNGVSWTPINAGLTNTNVSALAIDPGGYWDYGGETPYAGTPGGAYRNDGVSWTLINTGLTNTVVQALAIPYPPSGAGPDAAYAGTEGGVFKIATNGGSWTAINTGLTNLNVLALAIDPARPATLYAGTSGGGVFKSTNGGESWITTGPAKAADFYTLTPCRVVDTRGASGPYGGPSLVAGADRTFVFAGQCGIPSTATAVVLNVVAVSPTSGPGFLTLYPGGTARPPTSTINYIAGRTRANNAIISLGASLDIDVYCFQSTGTTDLVIDVNGYFQ